MEFVMKYKYLLFDADNTLFDFDFSEKQAFLSLNKLYRAAFGEDTYEVYHKINDSLWKMLERGEIEKPCLRLERFRKYLSSLGQTFDEDIITLLAKNFQLSLSHNSTLIDGVGETIRYLSQKYKIYIITNGISHVQTGRFNASVLKEYVERLFISEEIGYDKPDNRFFERVLYEIGDSDKSSYLVIGDSLSSDIDGALGYDIDCIYYDPSDADCGGRHVTYRIKDIRELMDIL